MTLSAIVGWKTISLKCPKYEFEFKLDELPYYQPKELYDYDGNIVNYCCDADGFMAYKTKYVDGKADYVYENESTIPLHKVDESQIKPFKEDGIVQITNYNCGPAAALQTIDLLELNNHITIPVPIKTDKLWYGADCCIDGNPENTDISNQCHHGKCASLINTHLIYIQCYREYTDRQISMMEETGTTWHGTPEAKSVAGGINKFFKEKQYVYMDINENKADDIVTLSEKTIYNLQKGYPVIYMVNVKSLSRYNAVNPDKLARHYITAVSYEKSNKGIENDVITVIDPNYTYNRRGRYNITLSELIHSMTQAGVGRFGNFIFVEEDE